MDPRKLRSIAALSALGLALLAGQARAANYVSIGPVGDYTVTMDNDRVYINHPGVISPCQNQRVEIQSALPFSPDYAKRITALVFGAYLSGRKLTFVFDTTTATAANGYACLLNSAAVAAN